MNVLRLLVLSIVFGSSIAWSGLVKCDSSHYVFMTSKNGYAFKIRGEAAQTENESVISVGGDALQSLVMDKSQFQDSGKGLSDKEMIIKSISREINCLSGNVFKQQISAQVIPDVPLFQGRQVVFWWYKMPKGVNDQVDAQLFLSTVYGKDIVGLSLPQFSNVKFSDAYKKLIDIFSTLSQLKISGAACAF